MIGLTPAILGLGLTRDELYEHCTRIARALFACVHPDWHNGTQRPEALHFSGRSIYTKTARYLKRRSKSFRAAPPWLFPHAPEQEEETLRLRFRNCKDATLC
jgi:hypothetical protein